MADEPEAVIQLLRSQKAKLIDILRGDPDYVLQHADSRGLLSLHGYQQVKSCRIPSEKVTDLLDHVIQRGPEAAQGLLELLSEPDLQEAFPLLDFIMDLKVNAESSGQKEISRKRRNSPGLQDVIPSKQICNNGSGLVKEKQLMVVARAIGKSWKEIGRLALNVSSVKLEQIEMDHVLHVERVFAMLLYWRTCQKEKATAAQLHFLLSQEDCALPPESLVILLED
ncbi:uncharacterized protein zgc:174906 [Antennarius striatus]|uniref:uncharacterized protein zgc:174906 n=1 Tax=Antennarius striatus TaxID=241820 RepID=UPI0035B02BA7